MATFDHLASRLDNETNRDYARRLFRSHPQLTLDQLSLLSGVVKRNLAQDPAFRELPSELAVILDQTPRRDRERNQHYARRLFQSHPYLTFEQLALLSGTLKGHLKADPMLQELPAELAVIERRTPRRNGETNTAYARRLLESHPRLTLEHLSLLSGALKGNLIQNPAFHKLPVELALIHRNLPRGDGEAKQGYARRLFQLHPQLTLRQLSLLSGALKSSLAQDPAFRALPAGLLTIRDRTPQHDLETNRNYARRLFQSHPQLTLDQLSLLSGVVKGSISQDPAFRKLPAELARIRHQLPQLAHEANQSYARRLLKSHPQLTFDQLSLLSGALTSSLVQDPTLRELPADIVFIGKQMPQLDDETKTGYACRLFQSHPYLTLDQLSLLSGVRKTLLTRFHASGRLTSAP
ncbi:hypothetical protein D0T25_23980 [Duganella sp. BJB488]|uniref:hypothetical protein n=1 Tax=unclassified Duganella TaxID=2636909 RepID=UPI000E35029D|nr:MULTISPECIES: hypothetical protein [unclassified Duganella]RFP13279.1 hypothetical protein D0T26_23640 [Duganella sp. BJB489]RFP17145.1 hypothetical protein D0T25_23980 [Duganella sp. BJB488]RFP31636.1 hypothetical protein D0T24_24735 [Duganella sp. BJB480]